MISVMNLCVKIIFNYRNDLLCWKNMYGLIFDFNFEFNFFGGVGWWVG